uniref:Uncharacterized protein n=1 Tax=Anguilla anguilla TaxID=7936 RepID=A0A0E9URA2_ANGAN
MFWHPCVESQYFGNTGVKTTRSVSAMGSLSLFGPGGRGPPTGPERSLPAATEFSQEIRGFRHERAKR